MKRRAVLKTDNLSDLAGKLKAIEASHINAAADGLEGVHYSVIEALGSYKNSRMALGPVLHKYREFFKRGRGWTVAMKVIAEHLGWESRTVHRIIEAYIVASRLPAYTLAALEEGGIDAAAAKNSALIGKLIEMPAPKTREEAQEKLRELVTVSNEGKPAAKAASSAPTISLEAFTERIVKNYEARYKSLTPKQRVEAARYLVESLAAHLRVDLSGLRSYTRPSAVPVPRFQEAA